MPTIIRNRTIRPSSRLEQSKSYKIDTKNVTKDDMLIVNIYHEDKSFQKTFTFEGKDVNFKNSISFRVADFGNRIDILWSGAQPTGIPKNFQGSKTVKKERVDQLLESAIINHFVEKDILQGLPPIINPDSKVLILGTMPGAESLRLKQYYGNNRNLFWKLLSEVFGEPMPESYDDKINLILKKGIALWDVCMTCIRDGSLDSNIMNEAPNELQSFIVQHPAIKLIAFNGKEAAKLFGKHIRSIPGVKLMVLPSTSPANAGVAMETKLVEWGKLKSYIRIS